MRKIEHGDYQLLVTDHVNQSNMILLVESARRTADIRNLQPGGLIRITDYEIGEVGVRHDENHESSVM